MTLETEPFPEPSNVSANPAPEIVPVLVRLISPALVAILHPVLPMVTRPLYVAADPEEFVIAPLLAIPVPLMVIASAVVSVNPLRSSTAPETTVVLPAVVPRHDAEAPNRNVPAEIVVPPAYVLFPDKVHVPVPFLFILELERTLAMEPLPVPPIVSPFDPLIVAVLVRFRSPLFVAIRLAPASVIAPL
jgi:hypothetical protein